MARIRSLKPEYFMSESVGAVSFGARLLFAGLWTLADREGRLLWKPKTVKAQIFPHDEGLQIAPFAEELVAADLLRFYQDDAHTYAWLPGFTKHQRPHPKEPNSDLPAWPEGADPRWMPWSATAGHGEPGSIPPAPVGREGKGMEGKGTEAASPPAAAQARPVPTLIARRNLRAAFEHPRFDVPDWWHAEKVKGLADGEVRLVAFYRWLSARVERTHEDTEPRKPWLNRCFEEWLEATKPASSSGIPSPAETRARLDAIKARAGQ